MLSQFHFMYIRIPMCTLYTCTLHVYVSAVYISRHVLPVSVVHILWLQLEALIQDSKVKANETKDQGPTRREEQRRGRSRSRSRSRERRRHRRSRSSSYEWHRSRRRSRSWEKDRSRSPPDGRYQRRQDSRPSQPIVSNVRSHPDQCGHT